MASQNNETPKNLEIGEYKTPEDLAQALEKRSKVDVARRIREIAGQVKDESTDLREKLKAALSDSEQKEIRETLSSTSISTIFDKGMSEAEVAAQKAEQELAGVMGAEGAKTVGKFQKILDRFDHAGDVYKVVSETKGGMAGTFAGIMAAIMYFLTGKAPEGFDFPWNKNGEKKEGEENKEEEKGKNTEVLDLKYQASSSAISSIFGGKSKNTLNKLFAIDKFQGLKYSEIKELYLKYNNQSNKDGLAKEVGLEGIKGNDIHKALGIIVDENNGSGRLVSDFYKKKGEEYEGKSIKELVTGLYSNIKIFKSLENITTPDQIINAGKNFALDFEQKENGIVDIKGEIYESLKELGISKKIILFIHLRGGDGGFKNISQLEKNLDGIQTELTEGDKKILKEKFIPFAKNINNTLATNFGGKYSSDILSCLNTKNLNLKELLELYALSGGNHEFEKMNDLQKTYIYVKLINILDDKNPHLAGAYGTYIVKEGETPLPGGVLNMLSYLGDKLKEGGAKLGKNLLGAARENPIMAGILALTLWFGPLFSTKESINDKMGRLFIKGR